jgi:hypothetical protein
MTARPRKKKWDDVAWETDGETINVEDTKFLREEREEPSIPYAPCPSRDAKWKALARKVRSCTQQVT